MTLMHPLDYLTLGVIIGVVIGLLWLTWKTYKELNYERSAED